MKNQYNVQLWSVELGKNKCWLEFTITIGGIDEKLTIEYCGTELNGVPYLSEKALEEIKKCFINDYGYVSKNGYDIKKCKEIFERNNSYYVDVEEE